MNDAGAVFPCFKTLDDVNPLQTFSREGLHYETREALETVMVLYTTTGEIEARKNDSEVAIFFGNTDMSLDIAHTRVRTNCTCHRVECLIGYVSTNMYNDQADITL